MPIRQLNLSYIQSFFSKFSFLFIFVGFIQTGAIGSAFGKENIIVIIGDSLTEGLGVAKENAYPSLLEKKILKEKKNWKVINSGVSGATSAIGPTQLKWSLKQSPHVLILALGANDGLRGIPVETTEKNLTTTIQMAKRANMQIYLAGMLLPPNYGEEYSSKFRKMYEELVIKNKIIFIPFLLDGVAGIPSLNQPDGIHPNEKGHSKIAETVFRAIRSSL